MRTCSCSSSLRKGAAPARGTHRAGSPCHALRHTRARTHMLGAGAHAPDGGEHVQQAAALGAAGRGRAARLEPATGAHTPVFLCGAASTLDGSIPLSCSSKAPRAPQPGAHSLVKQVEVVVAPVVAERHLGRRQRGQHIPVGLDERGCGSRPAASGSARIAQRGAAWRARRAVAWSTASASQRVRAHSGCRPSGAPGAAPGGRRAWGSTGRGRRAPSCRQEAAPRPQARLERPAPHGLALPSRGVAPGTTCSTKRSRAH